MLSGSTNTTQHWDTNPNACLTAQSSWSRKQAPLPLCDPEWLGHKIATRLLNTRDLKIVSVFGSGWQAGDSLSARSSCAQRCEHPSVTCRLGTLDEISTWHLWGPATMLGCSPTKSPQPVSWKWYCDTFLLLYGVFSAVLALIVVSEDTSVVEWARAQEGCVSYLWGVWFTRPSTRMLFLGSLCNYADRLPSAEFHHSTFQTYELPTLNL